MELHTPWLWLNILLFAAGFYILIKGSDLFVDSAASLARKLNISELVIGLTIVSIGTSLPELASSFYASICNQPDFIVGNIAGSITTNITLMLGIGIVVAGGMNFPKKLLTRDATLMNLVFFSTAVMVFLGRALTPSGSWTFGINRWCGLILLAGAVWYCAHLFYQKEEPESGDDPETCAPEKPELPGYGIPALILLTILSLMMITLGSKLLVDNVAWAAEQVGISAMVISATIVAFGTSVPELAVTIAGVKKGCHELALGNIIGSCIFNVLMIFGLCAAWRPLAFIGMPGMMNLGMMLASGVVLYVFMLTGRRLAKWEGWVLIVFYLFFLVYNGRELFGS